MMLDKLKALLLMPLGQKVALVILYTVLAWGNRRFGLAFTDDDLKTIAVLVGAAILGRAVEDVAAIMKGLKGGQTPLQALTGLTVTTGASATVVATDAARPDGLPRL